MDNLTWCGLLFQRLILSFKVKQSMTRYIYARSRNCRKDMLPLTVYYFIFRYQKCQKWLEKGIEKSVIWQLFWCWWNVIVFWIIISYGIYIHGVVFELLLLAMEPANQWQVWRPPPHFFFCLMCCEYLIDGNHKVCGEQEYHLADARVWARVSFLKACYSLPHLHIWSPVKPCQVQSFMNSVVTCFCQMHLGNFLENKWKI